MCELEEVMKKYIRVCPIKMKNDQNAVTINVEGSAVQERHRLAVIKDAEGREVARIVQMKAMRNPKRSMKLTTLSVGLRRIWMSYSQKTNRYKGYKSRVFRIFSVLFFTNCGTPTKTTI